MKIRTDFVTNSSSSNFAEIIVDNPVLLEILQNYKDMGLFGNRHPIIGIGCYDSEDSSYPSDGEIGAGIRTPAFYYNESTGDDYPGRCQFAFGSPEKIYEVLDRIIEIIENIDQCGLEYLDSKICTQLVDELNEKEEEINQNFIQVYWHNNEAGDGNQISEYEYDPQKGERYFVTD